ncbi:MAG: copper chaperone PCu(A)C [Marinospirillum sp.]|uniref:copper chaperone PCu(A)C n=1 Tax=Marinospirillum sp. TaxID=2183934 RepID=UPI0019F252EF|nr:copper chaperone PCu(A)C [Marinospirillum sp.]MBE0508958.1 copper chaperone PCu(A)C [Marinospirillum sp.]
MKRFFLASLLLLSFSLPIQAMDIQAKDAYVRAVPAISEVTAAFMQLHNKGSQDRQLVAANSPASRVVELHTHTAVDGVMQMRQVEHITLPAGGMAELKPGGLHLMLIGLKQPLKVDDRVQISLSLDDGSIIELDVPVRNMQMMQQHQHRH